MSSWREVRITIPSKRQDGTKIQTEFRDTVVEQTKVKFARWFGGVTTTRGTGVWGNEAGLLVSEEVIVVSSYFQDTTRLYDVQVWAKEVCGMLHQESVLVAVLPEICVKFVTEKSTL